MTRVLQLTSSYPRNENDNSSIFLRNLFQYLSENGDDIHVLAPHDSQVAKHNIDSKIKAHWFKYFPFSKQKLAYGSGILPNLKGNRWLMFQVPFYIISMTLTLIFICRKLKPNIIHAHWIIPQGFIAVIVGKLLNIPVIATAHGGDAFALNSRWITKLKILTLNNCAAWTANTKETANAFGNISKVPQPLIIPMGVNVEYFKKGSPHKFINSENRDIILFVGRLVEKKGVRYLINAFAHYSKKTQNECTLWIIGDGILRSELEQYALSLRISDRIIFFGAVKNKELRDYYSSATIFVAPSISDSEGDTEGQGVILLEAMACHTPIIASSIGGIPEIITNNETGILVRPEDPVELANAISSLLSNKRKAQYLASRAFDIVQNKYDWQVISDKFTSIYKKHYH